MYFGRKSDYSIRFMESNLTALLEHLDFSLFLCFHCFSSISKWFLYYTRRKTYELVSIIPGTHSIILEYFPILFITQNYASIIDTCLFVNFLQIIEMYWFNVSELSWCRSDPTKLLPIHQFVLTWHHHIIHI